MSARAQCARGNWQETRLRVFWTADNKQSMLNFDALGLRPELLQAVTDLGFTSPTEVQSRVMEQLLPVHGQVDLVALAQTGTGKTAAFGLPLLEYFGKPTGRPQALILSPTRELCVQISVELEKYAAHLPAMRLLAVYGGSNIATQIKALKQGVDIVIATPGRLMDLQRRGVLHLDQLTHVVLDEADEMLNMGFVDDIREVLSLTPPEVHVWLFSATMPDAVARISEEFMDQPVRVQVGKRNQATSQIEHSAYIVPRENKYMGLRRLLDSAPGMYGMVFCNTKLDTQEIAEKLLADGYTAAALHGDLSQQQRDLVMHAFRSRHIRVLVCTDVAARGIDVDDLTHVIHHRLPNDVENYTHRSGRTGRAGKSGESWILATPSEARSLPQIQKIIGRPIERQPFPSADEVCKAQLMDFAKRVSATPETEAVTPFMEELLPLFDGMDRNALIAQFLAQEFEGLFRHYGQASNTIDLNARNSRDARPAREGGFEGGRASGPKKEQRFRLNVGQANGFSWFLLKDWLRDTAGLGKYDILGVDVARNQSQFSVSLDHVQKIQDSLRTAKWEGQSVSIEAIDDYRAPGGGGNFKREHRPSGGGGGYGKAAGGSTGGGFNGGWKGSARPPKPPYNRSRPR